MVKKVLAAVIVLLVMVQGAFALEFWNSHYSIASLTDGKKPDYSDARFNYLDFALSETGVTLTRDNMNLTGTINLSGGTYSFWNGSAMQKVSGTSATYRLGIPQWESLGDDMEVYPLLDTGRELTLGIEADDGLSGVTATWNIPSMPSLNGSSTFPTYITTEDQLKNHVVYFEFIESNDLVTGINWRVVKASDTATPLRLDVGSNFYRFRAWNYNGDKIVDIRPSPYAPAGDVLAGTSNFAPQKKSDIWRVKTSFSMSDANDIWTSYFWDYYAPAEATKLYLFSRHASDALLVNGKSDYSTAKFSDISFYLDNTESVITEAKHFTDAGRITIPGGGYTIINANTGDTLRTVTGDATLRLKFDSEGSIGNDYLEYWTVDDSGRIIAFSGGADTGLNGKTLTWTFPAALNLDGSGTVPSYKSTASQLASGVPYIELVSRDGYITAVNYKIVTASNTSTAIAPSYRTDFRFNFDRADGIDSYSNSYRTDRISDRSSGTYTLETPQPLSLVKRVRVRLYTYDGTVDSVVYQWNFYPSSSQGRGTNNTGVGGGSSGGCNGLGVMAALALAFILSKKR